MNSNPLRYYMLAVLVSGFIMTGCSSSGETNPEDGTVDAELAMSDDELPDADEVGSIPEDDAFSELAAEAGPADPGGDDPFADLEDNLADESMANSMEVNEGEMASYTVKRGDTLMKIAFSLYGDLTKWRDLRTWNADTVGNGNNLSAGMNLKYVYSGEFVRQKLDYSYLIRRGDTLGGIARQIYGKVMKYRKLQRYNPRLVRNPNRIFAGFTLFYNITPQEQKDAESARMIGGTTPSIPSAQPMEKTSEPIAVAPAVPSAPSGQ